VTTQTWYGSVTELRPIEDTRGRLFEILRFAPGDELGQAYVTTCRHGIVKAWHHHEKQTDRMVCVYGTLQIGLWDEGTDKTDTVVSSTTSPKLVTIRPGVWHGFSSIGGTEAVVLNIPTRAYDPADPDEQRRPAHDSGIPYFWGPRDG
jgi:dTDP-4-dehydrorhamnose 3,5-epimerase